MIGQHRRYFLILIGFLASYSLVTLGNESKVAGASFDSIWFKGGIEKAFEDSQKLKKPVFLYWGAVWCPPCNELKSEVFSKPKFSKLLDSVIPVYLDGDTETAQKWGEQLKISGYPTIMILDYDKAELLRINESLNIEEFEQAFLAATALRKPIQEIIHDALNKQASPQVWQALAYTRWEQMGEKLFDDEQLLDIAWKLQEKVPSQLVEVRTVLLTKLLKLAAQISETKGQTTQTQAIVRQVKAESLSFYNEIFKSERTIIAARTSILDDFENILDWSKKYLGANQFATILQKWENSSKIIQNSAEASLDNQLMASYIPINIYRLQVGESDPLPQSLTKSVKEAVLRANKLAASTFERRSVITSAAYLLRQIEAFEDAEQLLKQELKVSKTPWYIESSLSRLAEVQNKPEQALLWSAKARESAQGKATKIEWTVNDLLLSVKIQKNNTQKIAALLEDYYQLVFSLNDGFLGRNQIRANKVLRSLNSLDSTSKLNPIYLSYQGKCKKLANQNAKNCQLHFSALLRNTKNI